MDIKGVGNSNYNSFNEVHKKQESNSKGPVNKADKIEISKEAKLLRANGTSPKDFAIIKERVDSGFYNSEEVINKVAENILKEIAPESD